MSANRDVEWEWAQIGDCWVYVTHREGNLTFTLAIVDESQQKTLTATMTKEAMFSLEGWLESQLRQRARSEHFEVYHTGSQWRAECRSPMAPDSTDGSSKVEALLNLLELFYEEEEEARQ